METHMNGKMLYRFLVLLLLSFVVSGCASQLESAKKSKQKRSEKPVSSQPAAPQDECSRAIAEGRPLSLSCQFRQASLTPGAPIFIRIFKESRELELWIERDEDFILFKTYPIACLSGKLGPKLREGDRQAPEGFYFVSPSMMNPNSMFHLSFNIGYPNLYDQEHHRTGSCIMVHGNRVSAGCFAMTDPVIEEIYTIANSAFNAGQPFFRVHIFPFRMTEENMTKHAASPHIQFWKNLQTGYYFFELTRRPPNVNVRHRKYTFEPDERGA